ncbi:hypothetical protein ACFV6E_42220 [Streptomyces sp. NPDC059785]|uniref:hypothetical protein n=1 Tax=Streptomyces sp. NPDC059785 TaxID=3346945 RepID=UPI00366600ED
MREIREVVARLLTGPGVSDGDLAREVRTPDPYVWRLPSPYEARWRRWHKRCREAGGRLPFPREEGYWQSPPSRAGDSPWRTEDDVVRPYVLKP